MALSRQLLRATRLFGQGKNVLAASPAVNRNYATGGGSDELRLTLVSPTDAKICTSCRHRHYFQRWYDEVSQPFLESRSRSRVSTWGVGSWHRIQIYYTNEEVKQVDVPAINSNFGIVKQHVPVLAVMKPGVVQVTEMNGNTKKIFVSSGSITINEDSAVHILAEEAHPLERFDKNAAMDAITKFRQNPGTTPQERMETEIAVNCLEELTKAL